MCITRNNFHIIHWGLYFYINIILWHILDQMPSMSFRKSSQKSSWKSWVWHRSSTIFITCVLTDRLVVGTFYGNIFILKHSVMFGLSWSISRDLENLVFSITSNVLFKFIKIFSFEKLLVVHQDSMKYNLWISHWLNFQFRFDILSYWLNWNCTRLK